MLWHSKYMERLRAAGLYRCRQFIGKWRLQPMRVGRWVEVRGIPRIEATNATAGDGLRIWSEERQTYLTGPGRLSIGSDVFINSGVRIECHVSVTIGDHVLIGFDSFITDSDFHSVGGEPVRRAPVVIGPGCWIAAKVTILPGVSVGGCTVVGANSVVTRDLPPRVLAAGNPARVIRTLDIPDLATAAWHEEKMIT